MFGLDDWIAGLSEGASVARRPLRRGAARPAPCDGSRPHRGDDDPGRVGSRSSSSRRRAARRLVGRRPRGDARRLRDPDPARRALSPGAAPAGRRERCRRTHRFPGAFGSSSVGGTGTSTSTRTPTRTSTTGTPYGRPPAHSGSGSCTAWAEAPASGSCSWPRSRTRPSRWRRSFCWRSSPRCPWRSSPPASA